jgi:SAM-dependent methyltransferase
MPEFDMQLFGEDYLYFWEDQTQDSDDAVERIWRILKLEPGLELLDLACGHGRIANRLAARGVRVTGLDATPLFLERARRDAAERGVEVEYVEGDIRAIPWRDRFDRVLSWFTSFGYHDDDELRAVLRDVRRALHDGGRFLLENNNMTTLLGGWKDAVVHERGDDFMVIRSEFDPLTSRGVGEYVAVRDGEIRRYRTNVRLFAAPELRGWMLDAGFTRVEQLGEDGEPLSKAHRRMLTVAYA